MMILTTKDTKVREVNRIKVGVICRADSLECALNGVPLRPLRLKVFINE